VTVPPGPDGPADGAGARPAAHDTVPAPPLRVDLEVGGRPVRVRVWPAASPRDGDGPLLLALHGWAESGETFGSLAGILRRRWTVLAPDAPAHGGTGWPAGRPYRLEEHALGVRALVDCLPGRGSTRRIVLLGHAMGALTAARVASMRRHDVVHLVLEEPSRTAARGHRSHEHLRTWLLSRQSEDLPRRLARAAELYPTWSREDRLVWARSTAEVDPGHLAAAPDWGEPLAPLLTGVRCPVTIVHGRRDRGGIVSPAAARRCADACPEGGEVVVLAQAGHHPRREAGERFGELLAGILRRHGRDREGEPGPAAGRP